MSRWKKKTETEEELVATPKFRFKVTNTRVAAYPTAPIESDYNKFKIGDVISRYSNSNIYEVVKIDRVAVDPSSFGRWEKMIQNKNTDRNAIFIKSLLKGISIFINIISVDTRYIIRV